MLIMTSTQYTNVDCSTIESVVHIFINNELKCSLVFFNVKLLLNIIKKKILHNIHIMEIYTFLSKYLLCFTDRCVSEINSICLEINIAILTSTENWSDKMLVGKEV